MKTKTFFSVLFLSMYSLAIFAQTNMKAEEEKVLAALTKLRSNTESIDREAAAIHFEKTLKTVLSKEESWNYKFPELRKYISVKTSKDKKIRTFSWDSLLGGSWHALRSLIQFKSDTQIHVVSFQDEKPVDEEDEGNDMFADAVILGIYPFEKGYLFEAFGTYGSGHHHKILAYFELVNEKLIKKSIFEDDKLIYVFKIARRYKFDLEVNIEKKIITHSEFLMNDDGFFQPTGKTVLLTFDGKKFVKQVKEKKP